MDEGFLDTDGEHQHDSTVSSLSVKLQGEVDLDLVQEWVSNVLQTKGTDIFRMKGVLSIANAEQKFVYQAVHMIFNGNFEDKWTSEEKKESKLVFIGKNLDHDELKKGFSACLVTPEVLEKKLKALRFGMGDAVQCNTGAGTWSTGKVVKLMYRDDFMPPGIVAPYQIQLASGDLIYAPSDEDEVIRKA